MKASLYTIVYAACVGTLCAALLTAAAEVMRPYREANERAEELRNILAVLEVHFEPGASSEELIDLFEQNVRLDRVGPLVVYHLLDEEKDDAGVVAVEIAGPGAWGPVRGFIALEDDWATIRGITFHDHQETPGLGGEISAEWFRRQFRGKRLFDDEGRPEFRIVRDGADTPNEVDAISGATITGDRVENMLRDLAEQIAEVSP